MEMLHDIGVEHGGLNCPSDLRHVLFHPDKGTCFIVDFADASAGIKCKRTVPILPLDVHLFTAAIGCHEAASVMYLLGMLPDEPVANGKLSV